MRPTRGELALAASAVRIARRRLQEYHEQDAFMIPNDVARIDALLRRALQNMGELNIDPAL